MVHGLKRVVLACATLCALPAHAETLPVSGIYPAGNDAAASLRTVAVDAFGGTDGQQVAIAIADRLREVAIDGEPYFRVLPSAASADAEAVVEGTATAGVGRRKAGTREDEVCAERDEDRDCIRKEKVKVPCWEAVVRLDASVRLIGIDGELLHAVDGADEQVKRYCRGEDRPSAEPMVRALAARLADRLRGDLAPVQRIEEVRVMESRKGLTDEDSRAFREAVRLTKTSHEAACTAWSALEARNPDHASVLFNLGLCAESRGELDEAQAHYRRAIAAGGNSAYSRQGLQRIDARRRADAQLAEHEGL